MGNIPVILDAAHAGLEWLKQQNLVTVKDISRTIQALTIWGEDASGLSGILLSKSKEGYWETDNMLLDTARACSALAGCGKIQSGTIDWLLAQQHEGCWNNSEIDTAYALIALWDTGVINEEGCEWLYNNYSAKWEYAGTTSLIITALFKQDKKRYNEFIKNRRTWILSRRDSGGWIHIATSNLAIQALVLTAEQDLQELTTSVEWLLEKRDGNNWGNINSTALSLISLKMYLDKLNSYLLL